MRENHSILVLGYDRCRVRAYAEWRLTVHSSSSFNFDWRKRWLGEWRNHNNDRNGVVVVAVANWLASKGNSKIERNSKSAFCGWEKEREVMKKLKTRKHLIELHIRSALQLDALVVILLRYTHTNLIFACKKRHNAKQFSLFSWSLHTNH